MVRGCFLEEREVEPLSWIMTDRRGSQNHESRAEMWEATSW
jgi:hypothetical protein